MWAGAVNPGPAQRVCGLHGVQPAPGQPMLSTMLCCYCLEIPVFIVHESRGPGHGPSPPPVGPWGHCRHHTRGGGGLLSW